LTRKLKEFLHFTSGVTWRVPLYDDGTTGTPEIEKKWTTKQQKSAGTTRRKKLPRELKSNTIEEEWL
jgi:hypothetical protein